MKRFGLTITLPRLITLVALIVVSGTLGVHELHASFAATNTAPSGSFTSTTCNTSNNYVISAKWVDPDASSTNPANAYLGNATSKGNYGGAGSSTAGDALDSISHNGPSYTWTFAVSKLPASSWPLKLWVHDIGATTTTTWKAVATAAQPVCPPVTTFKVNNAASASVTTNSNISLSWSATNSPTCTASGSWSGSKTTPGSATVNVGGTAGTLTYTLACTNKAGSSTASVKVTVTASSSPTPPPPPADTTGTGDNSGGQDTTNLDGSGGGTDNSGLTDNANSDTSGSGDSFSFSDGAGGDDSGGVADNSSDTSSDGSDTNTSDGTNTGNSASIAGKDNKTVLHSGSTATRTSVVGSVLLLGVIAWWLLLRRRNKPALTAASTALDFGGGGMPLPRPQQPVPRASMPNTPVVAPQGPPHQHQSLREMVLEANRAQALAKTPPVPNQTAGNPPVPNPPLAQPSPTVQPPASQNPMTSNSPSSPPTANERIVKINHEP